MSDRERLTLGGWELALTRWSGTGRALVALHGFTGGGEDFAPFAAALGHPLLAPDLPGHGATRGPTPFGLPETLTLLDAAVDALAAHPVLLGYSLGGRLALHLALHRPDRFAGLVLVGASPGLADAAERDSRRADDDALADRIEAQGVAWFTDWWAERPILRTQRRIEPAPRAAMRARRLANRAPGLAASLRGLGTGALPARWDDLAGLTLPTLLLTGADDPKFRAIAEAMRAALPRAEHVAIEGAGHCAHLERPAAAASAVARFLAERVAP